MTDAARSAGRPERPVRPALSREYIVRTALAVIDRDGLSGLSMRKLGAELGVDPMAVYHHLPNKAALFDGVVEAVYDEVAARGVPEGAGWRERIATFMRDLRRVLRSHPNALPVVSTRPGYSPRMLELFETASGILLADGFSPLDTLHIFNTIGQFTIGHALAEVGEPIGGAHATPEEVFAGLTPETHPNLIAIFEAAGTEYRADDQYELGLRALLDGFEQLRTPPGRPDPPGPDASRSLAT